MMDLVACVASALLLLFLLLLLLFLVLVTSVFAVDFVQLCEEAFESPGGDAAKGVGGVAKKVAGAC